MARAPRPAPVSAETQPAHPADTRRADVLAAPAGYTASIRAMGRSNTIPAATLADAAAYAFGLETAVAAYGGSTRAIVYALPADGGGPEVVARPAWLAAVSPATRATIARNVAARVAAQALKA